MNDNLHEKYIEKLLESTGRKHEILLEILRLTREQSAAINEDGIEKLEKLVLEKQGLIEQVDKLDEEFNACFQHLKREVKVESLDEMQVMKIEGLKELQEAVKQIIGLINEISEIEKQNADIARNLLHSFKNELMKINRSKLIKQAYGFNAAQSVSYFIDRKK